MSIPYQIADDVIFRMLVCEGQEVARPIADSNEALENNIDVMLRADPLNGSDAADPTTWIYVGNSTRQEFPLRDNESINIHVTKRNGIYFRGPAGAKLHMVSAVIAPGSSYR